MPYKFAYLVGFGLIMLFPTFLFFFLLRKDLRKEMCVAGLVFGIVAFLSEPIFIKYYWHPEYIFPLSLKGIALGSFEDFIYGFLQGGIAAVIFEVIFSRKFSKKRNGEHNWKNFIFPIYAAGTALFIIPLLFFRWNPIYTSTFALVVFLIPLTLYRRDLLPNSITSGILMVFLTTITYQFLFIAFPDIIEAWWKVEHLSGHMIWGIPIEELMNSFVVGAFGGPFYEFFNGLKFKRYKSERIVGK